MRAVILAGGRLGVVTEHVPKPMVAVAGKPYLELLVIVVTNQRGVSLGVMQQADVDDIHARRVGELNQHGARIDDVLCCPYEESTCDCRKRKPGLVLEACRKWNLDLGRSLLLGDSDIDRKLVESCGIPYIAVSEDRIV
jgi:D-glycero-D-manno-heptose 1,7-bisphosphate phosphatase